MRRRLPRAQAGRTAARTGRPAPVAFQLHSIRAVARGAVAVEARRRRAYHRPYAAVAFQLHSIRAVTGGAVAVQTRRRRAYDRPYAPVAFELHSIRAVARRAVAVQTRRRRAYHRPYAPVAFQLHSTRAVAGGAVAVQARRWLAPERHALALPRYRARRATARFEVRRAGPMKVNVAETAQIGTWDASGAWLRYVEEHLNTLPQWNVLPWRSRERPGR